VVEDDPAVRALYRTALHDFGGYVVVAVEDGLDALRYLDMNDTPAAVVLDLGLPRLHGRDVLNEMAARGLTPDVPVVVVTGQSLAGLNDRDFTCVLRKPVSPDQLVATVEACLAGKTDRQRKDGRSV
jgi:CheY-like chemotaxis protein